MEALLTGPLGETFLGANSITIGRMPTNQIVIPNDAQVSGRHAEIRPDTQGYLLSDLGSVNGTFVNGQRLISNIPYVLKVGDTIRIGQMTFCFHVRGAYHMASSGHPQQPQQPSTQYLSSPGGSQPFFQQPPIFSPQQQTPLGVSQPLVIWFVFLFIGLFIGFFVGIEFFISTSCVHYPFLLVDPNSYVACHI
jgi:predicted component of type VI protein secretion system